MNLNSLVRALSPGNLEWVRLYHTVSHSQWVFYFTCSNPPGAEWFSSSYCWPEPTCRAAAQICREAPRASRDCSSGHRSPWGWWPRCLSQWWSSRRCRGWQSFSGIIRTWISITSWFKGFEYIHVKCSQCCQKVLQAPCIFQTQQSHPGQPTFSGNRV